MKMTENKGQFSAHFWSKFLGVWSIFWAFLKFLILKTEKKLGFAQKSGFFAHFFETLETCQPCGFEAYFWTKTHFFLTINTIKKINIYIIAKNFWVFGQNGIFRQNFGF